jgi:hypothetical protein
MMNSTMGDAELSKRIDDLHRRFDDFRADQLQLRQEVQTGDAALHQEMGRLRQEMQAGHAALRQEMGQLRQEVQAGDAALRQEIGHLRESQDRKFTLMIQLMSVGLTLLAVLMTAYRFLRL